MSIPAWHDAILSAALEWREAHPEFRFNLRSGDITGQDRLQRGYWFGGNDRYLWFGLFRPNNAFTHTRSIGFEIDFGREGVPEQASVSVAYDAFTDSRMRKVHEDVVRALGMEPWREKTKDRFWRGCEGEDVIAAFKRFLQKDYPTILDVVQKSGMAEEFLIPEDEFEEKLQRVLGIRRAGPKTGTAGAATAPQRGALNLILYGPPGTGKTHQLRQMMGRYTDAAEAVDEETWLQDVVSGYGWRPVIAAALNQLGRAARVPQIREHPWVQAKIRQRGRAGAASVHQTIWSYLGQHTPEDVPTVHTNDRREPFIFAKDNESTWQLLPDWAESDPESAELAEVLAEGPKGAREGVRRYRTVTFHPSFGYEDFVRGIRPVSNGADGTTQFQLVDGIFKQICDEARANPAKRYALFIDEINRANVAKVFGELITLIEPDKRGVFDGEGRLVQGMAVQLPGGGEADASEPPFSVPPNLDIYGTMNTADRSIALLDVALRRRFEFQEMEPDYSVIDRAVGDVHLGKLLKRINDRLEYLVDRDHRIGHAYLIGATTLDDVRAAFRLQIIPLLQEYFFDDLARVELVLSTAGAAPFVTRERVTYRDLFHAVATDHVLAERTRYVLTSPGSWTEATFAGVYGSGSESTTDQLDE